MVGVLPPRGRIILGMAASVIHVQKAEAISDIALLLDRAFEGTAVVIQEGAESVKLVPPATGGPGRLLSESLAHARTLHGTATLDPDFAADVQAAVAAHREPLHPPAWD